MKDQDTMNYRPSCYKFYRRPKLYHISGIILSVSAVCRVWLQALTEVRLNGANLVIGFYYSSSNRTVKITASIGSNEFPLRLWTSKPGVIRWNAKSWRGTPLDSIIDFYSTGVKVCTFTSSRGTRSRPMFWGMMSSMELAYNSKGTLYLN